MFFKGSRYANVAEGEIEAQGRVVRYKLTRFIPPTRALAAHPVARGERLDHLAFGHYRDSERFWRICDANLAFWPPDLVAVVGRVLLVPRSEE